MAARLLAAILIVLFAALPAAAQCQDGQSCRGVPWRVPPFAPLASPTPFPTAVMTATPAASPTATPSVAATTIGDTAPTLALNIIDLNQELATFRAINNATPAIDDSGRVTDQQLAANAGAFFQMVNLMRRFQFGRMSPLFVYLFALIAFTIGIQFLVFMLPIIVVVISVIRKVGEFVINLVKP